MKGAELVKALIIWTALVAAGCGGNWASLTCDPSSCAGCCSVTGECLPGTTAAACGSDGLQCATCGLNRICKTDRTCGVDPNSYWHVRPAYAVIAATDAVGEAWDIGSAPTDAPDAVSVLWCPGAAQSTESEEIPDSYGPIWQDGGCTARAGDLLAEGFSFLVKDVDVLSDDYVCERLVAPVVEDDLGSLRAYSIQSSPLLEMGFEFQAR